MELESARMVYFSPTGTTRSVVRSIVRGANPGRAQSVDITLPAARQAPLHVSDQELLVVGIPVYVGRMPALLADWLGALQAPGTPTVCIVVYGNREYEDALLELSDTLRQGGCIPFAGAAFIGEHSFSDAQAPIAPGRPDPDDLRQAESFGRRLREKLQSVASAAQLRPIQVPGVRPYRRDSKLWHVEFMEVGAECSQCGVCAERCPAGAIDPGDARRVDPARCISCCACIKDCPQQARRMRPGPVREAQLRLHANCRARKEPEWFV